MYTEVKLHTTQRTQKNNIYRLYAAVLLLQNCPSRIGNSTHTTQRTQKNNIYRLYAAVLLLQNCPEVLRFKKYGMRPMYIFTFNVGLRQSRLLNPFEIWSK